MLIGFRDWGMDTFGNWEQLAAFYLPQWPYCPYLRKRQSPQQMLLEQLDIYLEKKMNLDLYPTPSPYTIIHVKWIIDLIAKVETIRHL